MRRLATLLLVPALLIGVAACGDDKGDSGPKAGVSQTGAVTANPAFGQAPNIAIPKAKAPTALEVQVLSEGTGPVVAKENILKVNYEGAAWSNRKVFDSSFTKGEPAEFALDQVIAGWTEGIPGHKVGSRLLMTIPGDKAYGEQGQPNAGIGKNETLVFVVDVIEATETNAKGTAQPANPDLPAVQTDGVKITGITATGKPAPTQLVSQVLIEGTGTPIVATDTLATQVAQYLWDGTLLGSSWGTGQYQSVPLENMTTTNLGKAISEALVGKKVGSRVMIVVPPDRGYGAEGNASAKVPANATLVVIFDVFKADQVPA